ncbi:hypothetical protein OB08_14150 [Microbacterium sp. HJ5]
MGLWRERWFRVLTILNGSLVACSALVGIAMQSDVLSGPAAWLTLFFPVVPVTFTAPVVSVVVIAAAAALSSLNMLVYRQKWVRFLRAFTVWGTLALTVPSVLACLMIAPAVFGWLR